MKLSIGIPVYNQAEYIEEAIQSIIKQSIPPFEVVVSENHSTDGTYEVVKRYEDRIKIIRPPEHLPMAANWNFCVNACTGDWVGLISGDDILLPDYVKHITSAVRKHPSAVFIMGGWKNFNSDTGKHETRYLLSMGEVTSPPKTIEMLLTGPKASFASFAFKRETFMEVGGYDENYNLIQDWILQFDFASKGPFVKINRLLARYRTYDRKELSETRLYPYLEDYVRYLNDKIWEASYFGVAERKIIKAVRASLERVFCFIERNNMDKGSSKVLKLEPVVMGVTMEKEWRLFLAGRWCPSDKKRAFFTLIKAFGRRTYNVLKNG